MATVAAEARKPRRLSGVELFSELGGVCMHSIFLVLSTFALPTVEWACFEKTDSKIEPLCWFLASKSTGEKKGRCGGLVFVVRGTRNRSQIRPPRLGGGGGLGRADLLSGGNEHQLAPGTHPQVEKSQ